MQVLRAFRKLLHICQVFNSENFSKHDQRIFIRNLCKAIVVFLAFSSHVMVTFFNSLSCSQSDFDLAQNGQQLVALLAGFQMLLIFVSITKKNRRINNAVECLQSAIGNRENHVFE